MGELEDKKPQKREIRELKQQKGFFKKTFLQHHLPGLSPVVWSPAILLPGRRPGMFVCTLPK